MGIVCGPPRLMDEKDGKRRFPGVHVVRPLSSMIAWHLKASPS